MHYSDSDFGRTDKVTHHIKLSDETPSKEPARPIHPQDIGAVRKHIRELLDAGVIRESESPFSSPIVVVCKKNGQVHLCIDYRRLNVQTIKDAYTLPKLEDTLCALNGAKKLKRRTSQRLLLYGLSASGSSTECSEYVPEIIGKMHGGHAFKYVLVFLDDLIVFLKTLEKHERLVKVLSCLGSLWSEIVN